jgi:hypothetical protein
VHTLKLLESFADATYVCATPHRAGQILSGTLIVMSDEDFLAMVLELHPNIPVFGSVETCSHYSGHHPGMVRRNAASFPELTRKSGRSLLLHIPRYLQKMNELPHANLTVTPDRPGTFARTAAVQAEAAAKPSPRPPVRRGSKSREPETATA